MHSTDAVSVDEAHSDQAIERLRKSEAALRQAQGLAQTGSWHWEIGPDITTWSEELYRIFGRDPARLPPSYAEYGKIYSANGRAVLQSAVSRTLEAGVPYQVELEYVRPDGARGWIEARGAAERDEHGTIVGLNGTAQEITARRHADEALRAAVVLQESQQFTRRVLDNLFAFVGVLGVDGSLVDANRAPLEAAGISPDQVVGKKFWETHWFSHSSALQEQVRDWCGRAAAGETTRCDIAVRMAEVTPVWIDFQLAPLRDVAGCITHLIPSAMDITARRETEAALRASEEFNRTVLESSPDCVTVLDSAGHLQFMNANGCALLEIDDLAALRDQPWSKLWPAAEEFLVRDALAQASSGQSVRFQAFAPTAKGTPKWWDVIVAPAAGRPGGAAAMRLIAVARDITARMAAEQALSQNAALFARLIDQAPMGVYVVDAGFRIQQVNALAAPAFGAINPLIGRDFAEIIEIVWGPEVGGQVVQIFRHTLASGNRYISPRFSHQRFDLAIEQAYEWEAQRVSLPDGQHGVVCYFYDTTERQRAEERLRTSEERLRQFAAELSDANRRKDEFLATLAHELRNPLAPVRNSLELMKRANGNDDLIEQARGTMERQVAQLVRLIDDLLDVSRITTDKLTLSLARVELASLVHDAVETCQPHIEREGQTLRVELPSAPIHLHADAVRLAQVLGNLLNNASKYTPAGGHIELTAEAQGEHIAVTVCDTGIGISAEMQSQVFDLFAQVDNARSLSKGGLGIGLALAKRLTEMHGGSIAVRSEGLDRGSAFVLQLPVMKAEKEPTPVAATAGAPKRAAARRILVVDDNRDGAESLAALLAQDGHETLMAYDGLEAVEKAASFRPHAILLDIGLPILDGHEACRRIRQQPWSKNTVIVALTGWGQADDRRKSKDAGFDSHCVKPIDHAMLLNMLTQPRAGYG